MSDRGLTGPPTAENAEKPPVPRVEIRWTGPGRAVVTADGRCVAEFGSARHSAASTVIVLRGTLRALGVPDVERDENGEEVLGS